MVLLQLTGIDNLHKPLSRLLQLCPVLACIRLANILKQLHPSALWKIRAAVERFGLSGQEYIQGPAALQAHGVQRIHVNLVHVGPLFPVNFDAHEMRIHHCCHRRVFKRLPLHHVAPMASCVPDAHQNGLLLGLGPAQRFRAPRVPVHGIVRVLLQVRAGFPGEAVGR